MNSLEEKNDILKWNVSRYSHMNNFYWAAQKGIRKTNTKWKEDTKSRNYVKNLYEKEFEELSGSVCHNFLMKLWGLSIENWNVEENKYLLENCQISWVAIEVLAWNTLAFDIRLYIFTSCPDRQDSCCIKVTVHLFGFEYLIEFHLHQIFNLQELKFWIYFLKLIEIENSCKNRKFINRKFYKKQKYNTKEEIFWN